MPAGVLAVQSLADGVQVTLTGGRVVVLTSADIPANVKSQSIANVQTWVNNWLGWQRLECAVSHPHDHAA